MKRVPRGTNGGVSMGGLLASAVGALVVALVSLLTLLYNKGLALDTDEDRLLIKVFLLSLTVSGKVPKQKSKLNLTKRANGQCNR